MFSELLDKRYNDVIENLEKELQIEREKNQKAQEKLKKWEEFGKKTGHTYDDI